VGISLSFLNQLTPYSIILKRNKIILHQALRTKLKRISVDYWEKVSRGEINFGARRIISRSKFSGISK